MGGGGTQTNKQTKTCLYLLAPASKTLQSYLKTSMPKALGETHRAARRGQAPPVQEGKVWRGSPGKGLHPREFMSPGPNDAPIEPSPSTPLSYQEPGGNQADPNTRNPTPLHKAKVAQPPAAELPRLLHCHGARALHPASP